MGDGGSTTVRVHAAAKINLTLHVTGKRGDGYHLLESLIGFTAVTDTIVLTKADGIALTIDGPEGQALTSEPDNLTVRAASLMHRAARSQNGVSIHLHKQIPVAAGLGGGSADAAAVVHGCAEVWDMPPTQMPDDETLAADLGADVPICRLGQAAWISGIGEQMDPAPAWPDFWLVLVNPRVPVPTAAVFQAFKGPFETSQQSDGGWPCWTNTKDDFLAFLKTRTNSLTEAALGVAPVIGDVLNALEASENCHLSRMSGSGPTCFGLFSEAEMADSAAKAISSQNPNWWVRSSPLLRQT